MAATESKMQVLSRVRELRELEIDYTGLNDLDHLSQLAADCAGTDTAVINLLDEDNQWTVSSCGIEHNHMPKRKSICQYTIQQKEPFEIRDLSQDSRFEDQLYVKGESSIKYYLGIPIITSNDIVIGALCILDKETRSMSDDQITQLQLIAESISRYFEQGRVQRELKARLSHLHKHLRKLAHDIRTPISSIITATELLNGEEDPDGIEELTSLIRQSAETTLQYADNQLTSMISDSKNQDDRIQIDLLVSKLNQLYRIQSLYKKIDLEFDVPNSVRQVSLPFNPATMIHLIGNLISNGIKYTGNRGRVTVKIDIVTDDLTFLQISVSDDGIGMDESKVKQLEERKTIESGNGTFGEYGYGIGLGEALDTLAEIDGRYEVASAPGAGTKIDLSIPVKKDELSGWA